MTLDTMDCITSGRVIVNGDDFGMSPGVNAAVKRLHAAGRLSSVSIMSNMPWSADALAYARGAPVLQAGAHLNLTTGRPLRPLEQVPSLVDDSGEFLDLPVMLRRLLAGRVSRDEIRLELGAQLVRCLEEGPEIQHVDSHMHFHAVPSLGRLVTDLASRHGVPKVRNPDFGAFVMPPPNEISPVRKALHKAGARVLISTQRVLNSRNIALTGPEPNARQLIYLRWCLELEDDPAAAFRTCLCDLDFGKLEIIAHPAELDDVLPSLSGYVEGRELELEFLASDTFRELMEDL
ncbi:MAG: ChbG/HpnK family deacetylase [Chloroflexota bacterium]|nr:MAG: ChbG/HpnK family deacetylase [Chloroflexota bacterium]